MPDADLADRVAEVSLRLISASKTGEIAGADVAKEIARSENDLYWAFQELKRRGTLDMYFPGGMGLPSMIRLP
jgi:bifunctional pyridoxal-dependent enzyme with beta-cystathionase and maltose regulon repressor activities